MNLPPLRTQMPHRQNLQWSCCHQLPMDCPPEICQGMTPPHEDLLFGSRLLLFYLPTILKPITEKFLVVSSSGRHSSPYCCWSLWWISATGLFLRGIWSQCVVPRSAVPSVRSSHLDNVNSRNCSCSLNRGAVVSVIWSMDFFFVRIMNWIQH